MAASDFAAMDRAVRNLKHGVTYRVTRPFVDANGTAFDVGRELTYRRWHYFAKDEEYTLEFESAEIQLSENDPRNILACLDDYLRPTAI